MRPSPEAMRNMLLEVRAAVEQNCDYVGSEFPEEARKIHYGETEKAQYLWRSDD